MDSKECSLFPFDLWEEILCRVPTKSLIRFKSTCKRWLHLFKDKRFIYKHLSLTQEHLIRINNSKVMFINPIISDASCSSLSLPNEFQGKPEIYTMIHCDGLLLCILESSAIAVWNPCLNQVRWIKPENSYPVCCFYGIGYNGLTRDGYKIMRFMNNVFSKNTGSYYNPKVDIYDFKSNSWKTCEVSLDWHVVSRCRGVSLKGNMYWIAKWSYKYEFFIQSFSFSKESFEPLCSDLPIRYGGSDVVALSAFGGNRLSLLHRSQETSSFEVWVTNKVKKGVKTSWTKLFDMKSHHDDLPLLHACENLASPVHFIDKSNRIVLGCEEVLDDEKNVSVNMYVIGDGKIEKREIERHRVGFSWPFICGYAYQPSLVPLP
ncbi:unnamed protein product [Cochlearia groenlandica]